MILIYTHKITKRIQYIFKLYFGSLLGLEFQFTSNLDEFNGFDGLKVSYTKKKIDDVTLTYKIGESQVTILENVKSILSHISDLFQTYFI